MANENQKMQVLDAHGLDLFAGSLKDGTLVVGKAGSADAVPWSGITDKPDTFTPSAHVHTPAECGIEPIPDETIEAIISGTWKPDE